MTGPSWMTVPLGDLLTDIQSGFASGKHNSRGVGIPHLRPMNVSTDGCLDRSVLKFVEPALADQPARRLQRGDVLFNNTNSPELVGKTALFDGDDEPAFSNHMTRLRVDASRLRPDYLALRLHQSWREGWFAAHCNNHVSQASIRREVLEAFEIELPPLDIQEAICKVSRAASRRRTSCTGHLAAARRITEQFKQAILSAACSGRLTADRRQASTGGHSVEPALRELGVSTPRNRTLRMTSFDLSLPDLPDTYVLTTVGEAALLVEYGTSQHVDLRKVGVPVLRMGNIQDGKLDLSELKYCAVDDEIQHLMLQDGDLLFNRTNSPELVGKSAVFHGTESITFASYLIRVRFAPAVAQPDFVNYWINSAWGRAWARQAKTDGVSQSNINGTKLRAMPLPLPPIEEQREIVRRASHLLTQADGLLSRLARADRRVKDSSQAVLAKAFRGGFELAVGKGR